MRHWTGPSLVQVFAVRFCGVKPLPESVLLSVTSTFVHKAQWILNEKCIQDYKFDDIVCKIRAILSAL